MTEPDVLAVLREAAVQVGGQQLPELPTPSTPIGQLGLDSVAVMELVAVVEHRLAIRIPDEDLVHAGTIGDLLSAVEREFRRRGAA